jgi:hypothetical protein
MQINDKETSWRLNNIHEQFSAEAKRRIPG